MNPKQIIEKCFSTCPHMLIKWKKYPRPLPPEIQDWHCYVVDCGHCIMSIVKPYADTAFSPNEDPFYYLAPVSVKAVLRGYEMKNGYVIADVKYDKVLGVIQNKDDCEYEGCSFQPTFEYIVLS